MKSVSVFCGSSAGFKTIFHTKAFELGQTLASRNIEVIYGGARVGLMGAVADGALNQNGSVIGIIPDFLKAKELEHKGLGKLITVTSMHERKTMMYDLSEGIIALPGGFGTLEELFEILTWAQLGLHQKPIAILNIYGYYDSLVALIQTMVDTGFLKEINQTTLIVSESIEDLIDQMLNYKPVSVEKWISKETT
jgi:hypothetical protein